MGIASFYRYFLAIRPATAAMAELAALRDSLSFMGLPVGDTRLHLTLAVIAEGEATDPALVRRVRAEMRGHGLGALMIALERLILGETAALAPVGRQDAITAFRASLVARLGASGISVLYPTFSPHVTLGYQPRGVGRRRVEPIAWLADRIVLVESHHGHGVHRDVAHWSLAPATPPPPLRQYCFDFGDRSPDLALAK